MTVKSIHALVFEVTAQPPLQSAPQVDSTLLVPMTTAGPPRGHAYALAQTPSGDLSAIGQLLLPQNLHTPFSWVKRYSAPISERTGLLGHSLFVWPAFGPHLWQLFFWLVHSDR